MRRLAISLFPLSLLAASLQIAHGCSSAPETNTAPETTTSSSTTTSTETDEEETADGLDEGDADAGTPEDDGGTVAPIPSKIRYVFVIVKENHTFDNLFTDFPGAESSKTAKKSTGQVITRPKAPAGVLPDSPCHSNSCGKKAYRDGTMAGFDTIGAGDVPFYRFTKAQLPNYWRYAESFVLADHLFQTTLGPSSTGHTVFWTGKSLSIENAKCNADSCAGYGCSATDTTIRSYDPETCETAVVKPCFDVPSLPDHLPEGFTWRNYGRPIANMVKTLAEAPHHGAHFRKQSDLLDDLAAGKLANLTILHVTGDVSEHPPKAMCPGENFTVGVVNALMAMPQWSEMAIAITWDDWGGFYDHVAPLIKHCDNGEIFQQGFRLPLILLSPYAKKGFVLQTPAEQASVPRMIEDLWGMSYMTERDPNARDGLAYNLLDAFDFDQAPREPLLLEKRDCP